MSTINELLPPAGNPHQGLVIIAGKVVLASDGTISSQTAETFSGAVVTKTGGKSGRYAVLSSVKLSGVHSAHVNMVGPDDSAFDVTKGDDPQLRLLASTGFSVQFRKFTESAGTINGRVDADPGACTFTYTIVGYRL